MASVDRMFKILVIGDTGAGKTAFVHQYVNGQYKAVNKQTVGVAFALKVFQWKDGNTIRLQMWDIAGQERFTAMTRVYYKNAAACVLMFDVTNRQSFQNSLKWKRDLDSKATLTNGDPLPCILLANKCDLSHRALSRPEINQFARENHFLCWAEVSVKENLNVTESMMRLVHSVLKNETDLESSMAVEPTNLEIRNEDEKKPGSTFKCCLTT